MRPGRSHRPDLTAISLKATEKQDDAGQDRFMKDTEMPLIDP
jgi:hypothetical protein